MTGSDGRRGDKALGQTGSMAWNELASSYDRVADTYEALFVDELPGKPRDRDMLVAFADAVEDPIAEIGCGPGQVGGFVRQRGRTVIGVDLSQRMAALARNRLDNSLVADLRLLPFRCGRLGGLLAFYSLIHVPRSDLVAALAEFRRVLRPGGRVLYSAHEGHGQIEQDEFLDEPVPFVATLFQLGELVAATTEAGFDVRIAERREPYRSEHPTVRLYVEAQRPGANR
jgi:SAM-dependent methyltransferase